MKRLGKMAFNVVFSVLLSLTIYINAFAAEAPVVVGLDIDNDRVGMFLFGELPDGLSAQISGWECEASYESLEQAKTEMRTLFLIDVSTSMRQGSRNQVKELLAGLIENKKPEEQYAIAAFGEQYRLLVDFTGDRYDISKAVEQLEWNDQASSIYDAVGLAAKAIREDQADTWMFTQVVVFSDGVERADDGIIKEELFFSLKESPLPVHTIGFGYENNADGLKELYAISRVTGGFSHELGAYDEVSEAAERLTGYPKEIYCMKVSLPEQAKDGAIRPLEILEGSGTRLLRYDIHMPRVEQATSEPEPEAESEPEPEPIPEPTSEPSNKLPVIVILAAGVAGVIVIAGIIFFLLRKNKKKAAIQKPKEIIQKSVSDKTQFIGADANKTTYLIADENKVTGSGFMLILNDLAQPHKRFEIMVDKMIEIGRTPNPPGISIDYDTRISRRHCSVTKRDGGLWIEDLGSANKTLVNGEAVSAPRMLRDNDVISCGKTKFSTRIERR